MSQLSNAELASKLTEVADGWQSFVVQQLDWLVSQSDEVEVIHPITQETLSIKTLWKIVQDYEGLLGDSPALVIQLQEWIDYLEPIVQQIDQWQSEFAGYQALLEGLRDQTEGYRDQGQAFRDQAEVFRGDAQVAANESQQAESNAAAHASAANSDRLGAMTAASSAQSFRDSAQNFRNQAEGFRDDAALSAADAGTAKDDATAAKNQAETASDGAVSAKDAAEAARDAAIAATVNLRKRDIVTNNHTLLVEPDQYASDTWFVPSALNLQGEYIYTLDPGNTADVGKQFVIVSAPGTPSVINRASGLTLRTREGIIEPTDDFGFPSDLTGIYVVCLTFISPSIAVVTGDYVSDNPQEPAGGRP